MQVPGRRVARHAGKEAVLAEQLAHVLRALGDAVRRDAHVLDDQRGVGRAHPADQAMHPLAHAPVELGHLGVGAELAGLDERVLGQDLLRGGLPLRQLAGVVRAELDEDRGGLPGRVLPLLRDRDERRRGLERQRQHQLDGGRAALDERRDGRDGRVDVGEDHHRRRRAARVRDGLEDGLGDEGQRALGAHDQAAEDLERRVRVEERAQAVAHGVLDLELASDPLAQLGVGADLVADLEQAAHKLRLGFGEALLRVRRLRVDRRSRTEARASWRAASGRRRGRFRSAYRPSCSRSRRRRRRCPCWPDRARSGASTARAPRSHGPAPSPGARVRACLRPRPRSRSNAGGRRSGSRRSGPGRSGSCRPRGR